MSSRPRFRTPVGVGSSSPWSEASTANQSSWTTPHRQRRRRGLLSGTAHSSWRCGSSGTTTPPGSTPHSCSLIGPGRGLWWWTASPSAWGGSHLQRNTQLCTVQYCVVICGTVCYRVVPAVPEYPSTVSGYPSSSGFTESRPTENSEYWANAVALSKSAMSIRSSEPPDLVSE